MEDLINYIFTEPDVLSPRTILEFLIFMSLLEFTGWVISWIKGVSNG